MGHNLTVHLLDSDGRELDGVKVTVDIAGIWKGGTLEEFTDDDGNAEFETAEDYESGRQLTIYVRGESFGPYSIDGGSYTVQLE